MACFFPYIEFGYSIVDFTAIVNTYYCCRLVIILIVSAIVSVEEDPRPKQQEPDEENKHMDTQEC